MKFSDIPGYENIKERLRDMVDSNHVPHAIMLSGISGIGKLSLARAFAQYQHCRNRHDGEPCGVCPDCIQHQSFNHADTYYVYPVIKKSSKHPLSDDYIEEWRDYITKHKYSNPKIWEEYLETGNSRPAIYVEEANDIIRKLSLSNYSADYKIMIVWQPEKFNIETANKLLKIIEEPFSDTRFIFVSDNPENVLPTVFSRTQRLTLPRMNDEQIEAVLINDCKLERDVIPSIIRLADGSAASAVALIEASGEQDEFPPIFRDMMRKAYAKEIWALNTLSEKLTALGRGKLIRFLNYCSAMIRENFIYNLNMPELNRMNEQEMQFSIRFAPFINHRNAEELTKEFDKAASDISRNANIQIVLFDLFISLIRLIIKR